MASALTLVKFAGIMYPILELGVLHIALTHVHMRHFHLGRIFKKNVYSMREHTEGVVTAGKGGHDYQPLALSYTRRFLLSLHPSDTCSSSDQGLLFLQTL